MFSLINATKVRQSMLITAIVIISILTGCNSSTVAIRQATATATIPIAATPTSTLIPATAIPTNTPIPTCVAPPIFFGNALHPDDLPLQLPQNTTILSITSTKEGNFASLCTPVTTPYSLLDQDNLVQISETKFHLYNPAVDPHGTCDPITLHWIKITTALNWYLDPVQPHPDTEIRWTFAYCFDLYVNQ